MAAADFTKSDKQVFCTQVTLTTPTIAANAAGVPDGFGSTSATVTGVKLGDVIVAAPTAALPTNTIFLGAYPTADDTAIFLFASSAEATGVTGASKTFNVQVYEKS